MKTSTLENLLLAALCLLITACGTDISESLDDSADSGTADFSTFVAVGDSLTAGYADSALYRHGQVNSYPAILAQQFAKAGGGTFTQPLRSAAATGSFVGIPTTAVADRLVVVETGNPDRPVTAATIDPTVPTDLVPMPGMQYNNFGVPGAKSFHLTLNNYGDPAGIAGGTANPFFVRFANMPGVNSVITDAAARMPTFFILWIGNNDILLNATAGSPGTDNPTFGVGSTDVTPPSGGGGFDTTYPALVDALKPPMSSAKGVLINIPKVTSIPYFTTIPFNAIPLDAATAATLNSDVADVYDLILNSAIIGGLDPDEADRRRIRFSAGQNPILISDDTLIDISAEFVGPFSVYAGLAQARQATAKDLIVLPASARLGVEEMMGNPLSVRGVTLPLEDTDVLTKAEVDSLEVVRAAYNATIKAEADMSADLLYFDAAALLEDVADGFSYGSGGISSAFIQGGGFSLDGVHPTARGYAVVANQIMKAIEAGFGAKLPPVNPSDYTTVFYQN